MKIPSSSRRSPLSWLLALCRRQRTSARVRRGFRVDAIGLPRPWRRRLAWATALLAGYCLATVVGSGRRGVGIDGGVGDPESERPDSFSEVRAVKEALERMRREYVREMQGDLPTGSGEAAEARSSKNPASLRRLEGLIDEFSGTEQELQLSHLRLGVLRKQEQWDLWLDAYLGLVYRHPTSLVVAYEADRARRVARQAGRETELDRAMGFLSLIRAAYGPEASSTCPGRGRSAGVEPRPSGD